MKYINYLLRLHWLQSIWLRYVIVMLFSFTCSELFTDSRNKQKIKKNNRIMMHSIRIEQSIRKMEFHYQSAQQQQIPHQDKINQLFYSIFID